MDIAFLPFVPSDEIYFCLECKRLNVRAGNETRPYFSEYVKLGMLRFVRGQYASAVHNAAMLAYVLDGSLVNAMDGVQRNITAYCQDLGLSPPGTFCPSSVRPEDAFTKETHHRREIPSGTITIHHLFVPGGRNPSRVSFIAKGAVPNPKED